MNRRALLAAGGSAAAAIAGCVGIFQPIALGDPDVTRRDGRTFLDYEHDGRPLLSIDVARRGDRATATDPFGLGLSVTGETAAVESFRIDLRAPPRDGTAPADVLLEQPGGGPWDGLRFERVADRWTRIALPDTGEAGDSTFPLAVRIEPIDPVETVGLRLRVQLRGDRRRYVADDRVTIDATVG